MRFPRRKKKTKDPLRCTYTTGALRVEGSRTVVLPGAGAVRTAENIRPLWRHIRRGTGRRPVGHDPGEGRALVGVPQAGDHRTRQPGPRTSTVGVDVGIGRDLLIVMHPDGTVAEKVPTRGTPRVARRHPRSEQGARPQEEGSPRWRQAKRKLARTHARAANIRTDAIHKATTRLAKTHGQVVIEDLAVRQLIRGLRSHRKSWTDAAAGEMRRQLTYKAGWYGSDLQIADRWYPQLEDLLRVRARQRGTYPGGPEMGLPGMR